MREETTNWWMLLEDGLPILKKVLVEVRALCMIAFD
jgi:hypothetical protein